MYKTVILTLEKEKLSKDGDFTKWPAEAADIDVYIFQSRFLCIQCTTCVQNPISNASEVRYLYLYNYFNI